MADVELDLYGCLDDTQTGNPENMDDIGPIDISTMETLAAQRVIHGATAKGVVLIATPKVTAKCSGTLLLVYLTELADNSSHPIVHDGRQIDLIVELNLLPSEIEKRRPLASNPKMVPTKFKLSGARAVVPKALWITVFNPIMYIGCQLETCRGQSITLSGFYATWSPGFGRSYGARAVCIEGGSNATATYDHYLSLASIPDVSSLLTVVESEEAFQTALSSNTREISHASNSNISDVDDSEAGDADHGTPADDAGSASAGTIALIGANTSTLPNNILAADPCLARDRCIAYSRWCQKHAVRLSPNSSPLHTIMTLPPSEFEKIVAFDPYQRAFFPGMVLPAEERVVIGYVGGAWTSEFTRREPNGTQIRCVARMRECIPFSTQPSFVKDFVNKAGEKGTMAFARLAQLVEIVFPDQPTRPRELQQLLVQFDRIGQFGMVGHSNWKFVRRILAAIKRAPVVAAFMIDHDDSRSLPRASGTNAIQMAVKVVDSSLALSLPHMITHAGIPLTLDKVQRFVARTIFEDQFDKFATSVFAAALKNKKTKSECIEALMTRFNKEAVNSDFRRTVLGHALKEYSSVFGIPAPEKKEYTVYSLGESHKNVFNLTQALVDPTAFLVPPAPKKAVAASAPVASATADADMSMDIADEEIHVHDSTAEYFAFAIADVARDADFNEMMRDYLKGGEDGRKYIDEALWAFINNKTNLEIKVPGFPDTIPPLLEDLQRVMRKTDCASNYHILFVRKEALKYKIASGIVAAAHALPTKRPTIDSEDALTRTSNDGHIDKQLKLN